MSLLAFQRAEPIAGYTIKERIGAGGYGEVWRADAPGGLVKAIKFIFGYYDDERAARELKALNRIKEVRHPFLLSLERIEVVDGQLVIVTELADASLKDRFEECKAAGQAGIPREELLIYLRDAADALDFMSERHSLQHLDVKPENLLLVGSRVKVADFGLVKDIHDHTASLMGGLTPVYAPPEVFDGRPSLHSDQYSLAIVYQEMLTGVLPFPGKTAAQLAVQHLQSRPRLNALPPSDQAVIARALSKQPEQRLPNCRALIDALCNVDRPAQSLGMPGAASGVGDAKPVAVGATRVADRPGEAPPAEGAPAVGFEPLQTISFGPQAAPAAAPSAPRRSTSPPPRVAFAPELAVGAEVVNLPPIELTAEAIVLRPTLLLGIGGTAAATFRQLRVRLRDQFEDPDAVPSVRMLLLDTDLKTLSQAAQGDEASALRNGDLVSLPLRKPEEYRSDSSRLLESMSRRWLYNIPRSLQTEGLRPLGRLALVDHSRTVYERLRQAIASICHPQAVAATEAATAMPVDSRAPRVCLVANIGGGAGGGMVLDLAYLVRKALAELGLSDEALCGLLAFSTERKANAKELAIANAYSCLSELNHYSRDGGRYPGDAACGLAAFTGDGPFTHTYLVHLGSDQTEEEYERATDLLAEYLYRGTVTPAAAFLDKCRELHRRDSDSWSAAVTLRSFGLRAIADAQGGMLTVAADKLCRAVIAHWCGESAADRQADGGAKSVARFGAAAPAPVSELLTDDQIQRLTGERTDALGLRPEQLAQHFGEAIERELGGDADRYFLRLLSERGADSDPAATAAPMAHLLRAINAVLGPRGVDGAPAAAEGSLEAAVARPVQDLALRLAAEARDWLFELVNASDARLKGALAAAHCLLQELRVVEKKTHDILARAYAELDALEKGLTDATAGKGKPALGRGGRFSPEIERRLAAYFRLRVNALTVQGAGKLAHAIGRRLTGAVDQLKDLRRELDKLAERFPLERARQHLSPGGLTTARQAIADGLLRRLPELAVRLERELEEQWFRDRGGLCGALAEGSEAAEELPGLLRRRARGVLRRALAETNIAAELMPLPDAPQQPLLRGALEASQPKLLAGGGAQRLLLLAPQGTPETDARAAVLRSAIEKECQQVATVVPSADGDLVFCYEAESLPLAQVAARLIDHRSDFAAVAARLHTRVDVAWTSLGEVT